VDVPEHHGQRLIAMSVPANGCVAAFRNPSSEVSRFFRFYHEGHFKIYNCCPEHPYPSEPFDGSVRKYDIQDHTPPRFCEIVDFLRDARVFVDQSVSNENVLAVHCRGGKGRTGSLCCSWLLYSEFQPNKDNKGVTSEDILNYFAVARSDLRLDDKLQGVDTPSQQRYVKAVAAMLSRCNAYITSPVENLVDPPEAKITLNSMDLVKLFVKPAEIAKKQTLIAVVTQAEGEKNPKGPDETKDPDEFVYHSKWILKGQSDPISGDAIASGDSTFDLKGIEVWGDVRVTIYDHDVREKAGPVDPRIIAGNEPGVVVYFIFHSAFINFQTGELDVPVWMMDKAFKDKKNKKFNFDLSKKENPTEGIAKLKFSGEDPWPASQALENATTAGFSDSASTGEVAVDMSRLCGAAC